jgi:hypothetical protein
MCSCGDESGGGLVVHACRNSERKASTIWHASNISTQLRQFIALVHERGVALFTVPSVRCVP